MQRVRSPARAGATKTGAAASIRRACRSGVGWSATPRSSLPENFHRDDDHGASLVIGDDKRRPLPEVKPVGELAYLRLHYGHRGRGGNYSEAELDGWRRRIAAWRSRRPVFAPVAALTLHPSAILRLGDHDEREDAFAGLVDDLRLVADAMRDR